MADIYTVFTRPISGTLGVTGSIYIPANQRLFGTASNAVSASAATSITFTPATASFATTSSAATSITFTPSTASFATTSSAATSITFVPTTASFATTASAATSITFTPSSASFATTASAATSITFTPATASFATTSSYVLPTGLPIGTVSSSLQISTGSFTGSFIGLHTGSFTGSFTGSLLGSASFATTASFASNVPKTKVGSVTNTSFTGNPRKATVTFTTAFANASYAVVVTGEDSRAWSIESKLAGSFIINANSNTALAGTTYWIATAYGEN